MSGSARGREGVVFAVVRLSRDGPLEVVWTLKFFGALEILIR